MYTGGSDRGAETPDRSPGAMEQGAAAAPEGRYYTHSPSPALQAVKKNINQMSGVSLGLRITEFILSLIAFSVMAAANQNGAVFGTFTTYSFVVAVNVIVCFYAIVQIIMTIVSLASGNAPNKMYLFTSFGLDQMFAFLLMAAGAAGASLSLVLNHQGVLDATGNGCTDGHIMMFCSQAEASVAFTFLSFFCTEISSLLGVYSLAPYLIL